MALHRVLPDQPVADLADHRARGGGRGLEVARRLGADGTIEHLEAAGLRGRGGAGFPTGTKWRTVVEYRSATTPTTVVVNGAEGEPGSFKDRALLRADPYAVLEGAAIAAETIGADTVIVALKHSFEAERRRVADAIDEVTAAGWFPGASVRGVAGPSAYLFGEETALLEVVDGRGPFPRVAPPYRQGAESLGDQDGQTGQVVLAGPGESTSAPPALANNVETMANVGPILAEGPDAFRAVGTDGSPGTMVFTVTGATDHHGVGELALGTPAAEVIERVGGGVLADREAAFVLSGVSNPVLLAADLDTPASFEGLAAAGAGLGAAGFIVHDDRTDPVAVALGVARFLSVESCGQCTPCKQDGLAIAAALAELAGHPGEQTSDDTLDRVHLALETVADGARCALGRQQQDVIGSLLAAFPAAFEARAEAGADAGPLASVLVAPIVDLHDGRAVLDGRQADKQPDWSFDDVDSGQSPIDRLGHESPVTIG